MTNWNTVAFQEVVVSGSIGLKRGPFGGTIKKEMFVDRGYKVYEQRHAIYGDFHAGTYYISEAKYKELIGFAVQPDDLLVSCSGTMGRIAIVPKTAHPGIINQALLRVRPDQQKVLPTFLKRLLETPRMQERLFGSASGSAIKNIKPLEEIRTVKIQIPPLTEQRRLAAILDQSEALRTKRRHAIAQLDTLSQSIFLEKFGDPFTNPKRWRIVDFNELLAIPLRNGLSPSSSGTVKERVLTLSAITGDGFRSNAWKEASFQGTPPADQRVCAEDLLVCRGNGNIHLVGKGYFPSSDMPDYTFPDTMIAARVSTGKIVPAFLQALWNGTHVRSQVESLARTTNGSFKINQDMLRTIEVVLPPLSLQREFAAQVAAVRRLKTRQRASLAKLDALFASLQHRAFRSEL